LKDGKPWEDRLNGYYDTYDSAPLYRSFQFTKLNILPGNGESDGISETERNRMEKLGMLQVRVLLGKLDKPKASKMARGPDRKTRK
jgi:hypothetical protein